MTSANADRFDVLGARLIDEGARLLSEYGPAGLSLRKLAAAAGTSTMAVYTRFGDKQKLLAAMHREGFRRLGEQLATASGADPLSTLAALGQAYRDAALANPHLYALMFARPTTEFAPDQEGQAGAEATYHPLVLAVRTAIDAGALVGDLERIALHLWVVVHGMVSLEINHQLPGVGAEAYDDAYNHALAFAVMPFLPSSSKP